MFSLINTKDAILFWTQLNQTQKSFHQRTIYSLIQFRLFSNTVLVSRVLEVHRLVSPYKGGALEASSLEDQTKGLC